MLVIGSAVALLAGGATYAGFTDQATGSGQVAGGVVDVKINGADTNTFAFATAECDALAPDHVCSETFNVGTGDSTLSTRWSHNVSVSDAACFTAAVPDFVAHDADGLLSTDEDHDADAHGHDMTLEVRIADNNECQGAQATVSVTVTAEQSETPYN